MSLKTWRIVNWCFTAVGLVMIFLGVWRNGNNILYIGGFLVTLVGVVIALVKCRCPHCGRIIRGHYPMDLDRCPFCGKKIN